MSTENIKAYHAAELFHLPARLFNEELVKNLEESGIKVFSPQRDGFEFSQLIPTLSKNLSPKVLDEAMQTIIYAYDILSISKVDVVVARFDEPPDPGVDTEVLIANALGIPVIAYRTDVRSPYGDSSDKYGGMHSFPVKTSEIIIIQESSSSAEKDIQTLSERLVREIKTILESDPKINRTTPEFLQSKLEVAHTLFDGIEDIHSEEGLADLAKRCLENKEALKNFGPRVIRLGAGEGN